MVLAWIFLQTVERFAGLGVDERVASISVELALNLFGFAAVVVLFAAPLLAMRVLSWGDPRRQLRSAWLFARAPGPGGPGQIRVSPH